jgi:hypothetical protein
MNDATYTENVTISMPHSDLPVMRSLSKRMGWKLKVQRKPSLGRDLDPAGVAGPCQYTKEEVEQRVMSATADIDAGVGLLSNEDFKKQVRTWYK